MKLSEWIKKTDTETLRKLARAAGCHPLYIYGIAKDGCSPVLAQKIVKTIKKMTPDRIVTLHEIRPDIWKRGE
jgi:hypothetical protein